MNKSGRKSLLMVAEAYVCLMCQIPLCEYAFQLEHECMRYGESRLQQLYTGQQCKLVLCQRLVLDLEDMQLEAEAAPGKLHQKYAIIYS